jgi:hypothetical protein
MNVQPDVQMDKAAFLAGVEGREGRYELAGGRVLMMTAGTMGHGLIVGNLFRTPACAPRPQALGSGD